MGPGSGLAAAERVQMPDAEDHLRAHLVGRGVLGLCRRACRTAKSRDAWRACLVSGSVAAAASTPSYGPLAVASQCMRPSARRWLGMTHLRS